MQDCSSGMTVMYAQKNSHRHCLLIGCAVVLNANVMFRLHLYCLQACNYLTKYCESKDDVEKIFDAMLVGDQLLKDITAGTASPPLCK